jgi:hypothetical protein
MFAICLLNEKSFEFWKKIFIPLKTLIDNLKNEKLVFFVKGSYFVDITKKWNKKYIILVEYDTLQRIGKVIAVAIIKKATLNQFA